MNRLAILLFALAPAVAHADKNFNSGNGGSWDCAKDPVVHINAGKSFSLAGACKEIDVNASQLKLTIESVDELQVNGSNNAITAGVVNEIQVNGNDNAITYKKAMTGAAPEVHLNGERNAVSGDASAAPSKPADKPASKPADKPASKPADKPADNAGSGIDCAKQPTTTINNGRGTYRFTGTCEKISVNGGENKLTIENVQQLTVTGSNNQVDVGGADKIFATGSDNKITYKKGLSGAQPKVSSVGNNNKIDQVK